MWQTISDSIKDGDIERFVRTAVPASEGNPFLFGHLFMKMAPAPHLWAHWPEIQRYNQLLIRVFRGGGKTTWFTTTTMIHDLAYSILPNSKFEDPRILAIFETRTRADERMTPVMEAFETGGPGGLLGAVFHGQPGTKYAGMSIPEIAKAHGEWNSYRITLPHPRGLLKPDPSIRALAPNEALVGFHPRRIIMDDVVGPKSAGSQALRNRMLNTWEVGIKPMRKPWTKVWVPHTVFHEDDLNEHLRLSGEFYPITIGALDRMPSRDDYEERFDENGVVSILPTDSGRKLVSPWPCPGGDDWACPMTKEHMDGVGEHRPVPQFIMDYRSDPITFALQWMHILTRMDEASVKPWMVRFFTRNPNDGRIGKPAPQHSKWVEWATNYPDAGLSKSKIPVVVFLAPSGEVFDGRGGAPVTRIERIVHGWDLAIGKNSTNDRTALCRTYRTADKRYFNTFSAGRFGHDQVWRKMVLEALHDPYGIPAEVAVEVNGFQEIYANEVRKLQAEMRAEDKFKVTEIKRVRDKDKTFVESGLPVAMSNGRWYMDIDDDESLRELLSVTPDQKGGHDDIFDAAVNSYSRARHDNRLAPGLL